MASRFELLVSCAFLALILFGLHQTYQIDLAFSSDLETFSGPRAYPGMILGLMLVTNVAVILSLLFSARPADADPEMLFGRGTLKAALLMALLVVFALTFEPVGYLLTMIPLLVITAMMNGSRSWLTAIVVSIIMSLACLAIFRYGLNVVLPEGLLGIDMVL